MGMKKIMAVALCLASLSVTGVMAAGVGVVDFAYLEKNHPKFNKTVATYQADVRDYRNKYEAQSRNLTEENKEKLMLQYNGQLEAKRVSLFRTIDNDVIARINAVSKAKGLDAVAVKGYVISGTVIDITADVAEQLKK